MFLRTPCATCLGSVRLVGCLAAKPIGSLACWQAACTLAQPACRLAVRLPGSLAASLPPGLAGRMHGALPSESPAPAIPAAIFALRGISPSCRDTLQRPALSSPPAASCEQFERRVRNRFDLRRAMWTHHCWHRMEQAAHQASQRGQGTRRINRCLLRCTLWPSCLLAS